MVSRQRGKCGVVRGVVAVLSVATLPLVLSAALLVELGFGARSVAAAGEQIVVSTRPELSQIHPHGGPSAGLEPDTFIVEVKDASGRPVPNVKLDVRVTAPPTNWFVSTDVPRIEGHDLLDWSAVAPDGRQEFQYAFPIRGAYHLTIKANPAPGAPASFSPITRETDLSISEKPKSFLYLGLFLAVLFLFGTISGVVLGRANAASRAR